VTKTAAVWRILERYLVEVVERQDLCPWAASARENGEIGFAVAWGMPSEDDWVALAAAEPARPNVRVAMIVAPELAIAPAELRALRDRIAARIPTAGIAEFHPDAALDLASPARLVPFLRRAPDPMLQLVPLALLDSVRGAPPVADRARQAAILTGHGAALRASASDRIAAANHATVTRVHAEIEATLAAIAADRIAAYRAAGIGR